MVIWDQTRLQLMAARDRFGIKPLFDAWHEEKLYLASEVKALWAAGVPARWDEHGVYNSVALSGHMGRTLYGGIFQIPPGHFLIATEKHVQLNQYWDFDYPTKENNKPNLRDQEYAEEFRTALEEAVRIRRRAGVAVGVNLSGGLTRAQCLGLQRSTIPER